MSEWSKYFLGIGSLVLAVVLALLAVFGGGLGSVVSWMGGDSFGISLKTGAILGVGFFCFFAAVAAYFFIKINDWSWAPIIGGAVYAVLPDLLVGPQDDIVALILGAAISGFLAWHRQRDGGKLEAGGKTK